MYKKKYKLVTATLKLINKTSYNKIILAQEDMVCFQILDEEKTKSNKYGNTRQACVNLSINFDAATDTSKTILNKKFSKYKLRDVTKVPK